eukprot:TRINITY_DN10036_c0_g1_i1.p1 TRINITY_DN10036_c0_g1~~TRINITY_DN10036_c0_g1_i1.p1  ORF type:complete len:253 (+),score=-0.09 TRINITY_DN10036_c0_g1_i1:8-766(+)
MLLYILLILSIGFSDAAILSATYNDGSCASNSRIAFYYDSRENITCNSIGCSPIGDGNYYEVKCDQPLSSLDNSGFIIVNYYDSFTGCSEEAAIMAYGGVLGNNAVKIYQQTFDGWISVQFILIDTVQFTKCNLTATPFCTTQFAPLSCTLDLNLEAGYYWKYTLPTSTPIGAPIESPISSPDSSDQAPSDTLPSDQTFVPIDAPIASNEESPQTPTSQQIDIVRCNCDDLANCHCHMSCQMVDDVVKCTLG